MKESPKCIVNKGISCLIGLGILLLYLHVSSVIVRIFSIPFPPTLIGLVLLCISLQFKFFPQRYIRDISDFMLNHIVLFFVPLTVGIMAYIGLVKENLLSIFIVVSISTFISFTLTALLVENIIKYKKIRNIKRFNND